MSAQETAARALLRALGPLPCSGCEGSGEALGHRCRACLGTGRTPAPDAETMLRRLIGWAAMHIPMTLDTDPTWREARALSRDLNQKES